MKGNVALENTDMQTNPILDIIINVLENTKYYNYNNKMASKIECEINGEIHTLWNADYLLGQIIRQYKIAGDNFYISKGALDIWSKISDDSIQKYSYRDNIKCARGPVTVKVYKGASSKYEEVLLDRNSTFIFNDVFHDDHIIPVNVIIKELRKLTNYSYENVSGILNRICICRMLKEEDRRIIEKSKRPFSVETVIKEIYAKYDIEAIKI